MKNTVWIIIVIMAVAVGGIIQDYVEFPIKYKAREILKIERVEIEKECPEIEPVVVTITEEVVKYVKIKAECPEIEPIVCPPDQREKIENLQQSLYICEIHQIELIKLYNKK